MKSKSLIQRIHILHSALSEAFWDGHICTRGSISCYRLQHLEDCQFHQDTLGSSGGDTAIQRFYRVFDKELFHQVQAKLYTAWAYDTIQRTKIRAFFPEAQLRTHPLYCFHSPMRKLLSGLFPIEVREVIWNARRLFMLHKLG